MINLNLAAWSVWMTFLEVVLALMGKSLWDDLKEGPPL